IAPGQKITFSRIRVLTYLAQAQGEQVSIRDLAEELGVTSGGVSQMIDSLVKSDMVCRTTSKDDRRVVHLSISDNAKKSLDILSLKRYNSIKGGFCHACLSRFGSYH
ncbi:MAG: MarR family winged helix-turn-helix transcriptional regulator, partial [Lachnospiraceae bacterium]